MTRTSEGRVDSAVDFVPDLLVAVGFFVFVFVFAGAAGFFVPAVVGFVAGCATTVFAGEGRCVDAFGVTEGAGVPGAEGVEEAYPAPGSCVASPPRTVPAWSATTRSY
ncbi:hypothetical protein AB0E08_13700 [Streptomyces sp. NPDC048281]|uniref:hypothetical protein n=1 Tax=Streptomyces sp. NPDC048281 TaxID=3154715 RepID=UPI00341DF032